jgi:hypothetical protein
LAAAAPVCAQCGRQHAHTWQQQEQRPPVGKGRQNIKLLQQIENADGDEDQTGYPAQAASLPVGIGTDFGQIERAVDHTHWKEQLVFDILSERLAGYRLQDISRQVNAQKGFSEQNLL